MGDIIHELVVFLFDTTYTQKVRALNSIIEALSSATAAFSFRVYLPRNYEGRKTEEFDTQFVWKSLARL